jgi:hypothetical protein
MIVLALVLLLAIGIPVLMWNAIAGLAKLAILVFLVLLVIGLLGGAMRRTGTVT